MKNIRLILASFLLITFMGCEEDERGTQFLDNAEAPSEVLLQFRATQDNSGAVTITPNAVGATQFEVFFGDGTGQSIDLEPGQSVDNVYTEGTYTVGVTATSVNGLKTQAEQQLVVSFEAPQNLVVTIENDGAISKQVNVTATADFAMSYDVYFGEPGNDTPMSANIGDALSYTYQDPGTYTITVVAMGSAIETTTYVEENFEVTEILAPVSSAATPPARAEEDVVSIFSDAYTDIVGTDFFPNWGQSTIYTAYDLNGDAMIQYSNLNYEGINIGESVDAVATSMETLHIDIWTPDATSIDIYPLPNGVQPADERFVTKTLVPNEWNSFDIPMEDFTSQGLPVDDLLQFKFVGSGTVFIDNLYFYKEASGIVTSMIEDFEGTAPTFTTFGNIAGIEVIANPDQSGANTTNSVAKMTKTAGSEVWAGSFFETPSSFDLASYGKINVKIWSPVAGIVVKLKLENADASITTEVDLNSTIANQWENLLYDFSEAPLADYTRVVIFFDFGNSGDDSVYYYDEIELVNDSGNASLGFQDFEGDAPAFTVFGNIADIEVIANPDASGANTTANVAKMTKTAGSEVWAGSFFETDPALDLNTYSKISVKTWSPIVGAQVKLKLENADASIVHEVDLNTSVASAWEDLVYDFSGAPAADYVRVVIFFDFGNAGDDSVYYYDEYALTN